MLSCSQRQRARRKQKRVVLQRTAFDLPPGTVAFALSSHETDRSPHAGFSAHYAMQHCPIIALIAARPIVIKHNHHY
jgi:hypothetical protein